LGADDFQQLEAPRLEPHHVRPLERLGSSLTLSARVA
jgi:hypothetical protein